MLCVSVCMSSSGEASVLHEDRRVSWTVQYCHRCRLVATTPALGTRSRAGVGQHTSGCKAWWVGSLHVTKSQYHYWVDAQALPRRTMFLFTPCKGSRVRVPQ